MIWDSLLFVDQNRNEAKYLKHLHCLFCRYNLCRTGRISSGITYSTGKIARRICKSIVGWNILMARSQNQKVLSGFGAQLGRQEGVSVSGSYK